ncbi:MAG: BatD protein [Flavobacteriaceae bacterium CG2_30_34_30]|nr:MAG: BatD protein [Flavobacteriaceae bacterium CG2_30_34_30]PIZ08591.1 MAG: BatD protein [Flavobacteriaceae bacterium CG_4_10_14_0_8_um_filter_34_31]
MKLKFILLSTLILLATSGVFAQVKFEAKVSKSSLGINERLRVDFEMNQDGDNFQPPNFQGFRVVGGPNQSISNSWINGRRTYSKTFSYFLSPTARGKFTIGQATIQIDGETFKTVPINVEVTAAVDQPKDGENPDYLTSENIHLVAEISKTNPYLNEAITVVYKLYVSPETAVSGWREIDNPKFADFWSQNTDNKQFQVYEGTYQGKPYRYAILRSTVLYPQKTGKLEIEPLSLDVQVEVRTNRRDIFGRPFMTHVNKTVSAGTKTIEVKPLPNESMPANFSGAVGKFDFKVKANKTKLDARESLEILVEVSGNGNLKLFKPPRLVAPNNIEVYEPEFQEKVTTTDKGMRGSISENYTIIPQFKGNYPIKPLVFTYFDIESETYKTITSDEIIIEVEKGPVTGDSSSITATNSNKKAVILTEDQFKYIKLKPELKAINSAQFFKSPLFWSLLTGPLVLIPLFILIGKKRRELENDVEGKRLKKANRLARKYLSEAKKNSHNQKQFYESLERALHNYLKAKLSIETSEFSKERINSLLQERRVEAQVSENFISILKNCEYARYTPATDGTIQQDYEKAVQVISTIDKQIA